MRAITERQFVVTDVGCFHRDRQAVVTDAMGDGRLQRAGPTRLRMNAYPIHDCIGLMLDQHPRDVASEAVARVMASRFGDRKLLSYAVEGVIGRRVFDSARESDSGPDRP